MRTTTATLSLLSLLTAATALPTLSTRQASACFIVGNEVLPEEVADVVTSIQSSVTCAPDTKTLGTVPDVTSGSQTYSAIDFSASSSSPLSFALSTFNTATPLADSNLDAFTDALNVYLATEAGLRSEGGNLAIKVPKFFLQMQISRIQTAQGNPPKEPGQQVEHLRDKVTKNAAGEDKALLDQVVQLAAELE